MGIGLVMMIAGAFFILVSLVLQARNLASFVKFFNGDDDDIFGGFTKNFKRQLIAGGGLYLGIVLMVLGAVIALVQALSA